MSSQRPRLCVANGRARCVRIHKRLLQPFGVLDEVDEGDLAELEAEGMAAELHDFAPLLVRFLRGCLFG